MFLDVMRLKNVVVDVGGGVFVVCGCGGVGVSGCNEAKKMWLLMLVVVFLSFVVVVVVVAWLEAVWAQGMTWTVTEMNIVREGWRRRDEGGGGDEWPEVNMEHAHTHTYTHTAKEIFLIGRL